MPRLRREIREAVFERDNYTCRYCGRKITELRRFHRFARRDVGLIHVDHVIPRCRGGSDEMDNLVTACQACNLTKYNQIWQPIPLDRASTGLAH